MLLLFLKVVRHMCAKNVAGAAQGTISNDIETPHKKKFSTPNKQKFDYRKS